MYERSDGSTSVKNDLQTEEQTLMSENSVDGCDLDFCIGTFESRHSKIGVKIGGTPPTIEVNASELLDTTTGTEQDRAANNRERERKTACGSSPP